MTDAGSVGLVVRLLREAGGLTRARLVFVIVAAAAITITHCVYGAACPGFRVSQSLYGTGGGGKPGRSPGFPALSPFVFCQSTLVTGPPEAQRGQRSQGGRETLSRPVRGTEAPFRKRGPCPITVLLTLFTSLSKNIL